MSELEARFRVSLQGKNELTDFFNQSERSARSFGSTFGAALKSAGKDIASFGLSTANSLRKMATGDLGIAAQAKSVLQLRDSISQLAVMAGKGADAVEPLRQQIHAIATASNQMQGDVTEALSAFVERTGDLDTARRNMELYGKAATATGASLQDIAYVGAELSQKLGIKDQGNAFAILASQSKAGSIELRDLATKGPRIFAAGANYGLTGERGVRELGALAQVVATSFGGKGSAASTATSIENIFANIAKKADRIEGAGIKVKGRDPIEVMFDIIRKTNGDVGAIQQSKIFTQQGMRGVSAFARMFRDTGGFGQFEQFRDLQAGNVLDRDFATRRGTGAAALAASQISIAKTVDDKVGPAFERLAGQAHYLADGFAWSTEHMKTTAAALVAAIVGKSVISGALRGAGGGIAGRLLGGGASVQNVFVTNWPGNTPGGGPGPPGSGGGKQSAWARLMSTLAVGATAYYATQAVDDLTGGRISGGVGNAIGALSGQKGRLRDLEEAGAAAHRAKIDLAKTKRAIAISQYEAQGLTHGQAVFKADAAVQNLTVYIDGDKASAEADEGTRSPDVMVKRGAFSNGARVGR